MAIALYAEEAEQITETAAELVPQPFRIHISQIMNHLRIALAVSNCVILQQSWQRDARGGHPRNR